MAFPQSHCSNDHGEMIISVAKEIGKSWPGLRDRLQQRQATGDSLNDANDANLQNFDQLISLLTILTAEAEAPTTQRDSMMPRGSALPLRRFLEEENEEWDLYVEQDPTYAVSNNGTEAQRLKGKYTDLAEKLDSPSASSFSLVADSALSTAVSDGTIVLDASAIQEHQAARKQLDEATLRDLNEKLCRIVTSGQATKNIIARATDLIKAGADVNARDEWCDGTVYDKLWQGWQSREGWLRATVLYGAVAAEADCDVVRLLLNAGADINKVGGFNATPLRAIVQTDGKDVARLLLNRGADLHVVHIGLSSTVLGLAVRYGTIGMVELLVDRGATVTEEDVSDETALHSAAYRGHVGMVKLLLDAGAAINAQSRAASLTPLAEAVKMAHETAVQTLLVRGADVTLLQPILSTYAKSPKRECLTDMLREYGADYTCSTPEVPQVRGDRLPIYELVRQGHVGAALQEPLPAQLHKKMEEEPHGNGQSIPEPQNIEVKCQATAPISDTTQREETSSIRSSQTNSTTKTDTEQRKKFWSRFSSQTTLHENK